MAPRSGALRAVRAGVLGLVSALLAGGAHLAGGGGAPGAVPALLLGSGVVLVSVLLTRVRLGFPTVLVALALGQLLLHHLLGALVVAAGPRAGTSPPASSGHLHHGGVTSWVPALLGVSGGPPPVGGHGVAGTTGTLVAAGPSMTLLHVLATLLGALLVARGEAALWALVLWCRPALPGPAVGPPATTAGRAGWVSGAPVLDLRRPAPAAPRGPPVGPGSAALAA